MSQAHKTRQQKKSDVPPVATAIGYVRVSTEEQSRHGVSLAAQTERVKAYCVAAGLELERVISEEGVSAGKTLDTRPGGAELTSAIGFGIVTHVVALKLDRLFRNAEDALSQTRRWDKAGVALHIIDMGGASLNTSSAMGRMFLTMAAGFAELERNLISERTTAGLQHKKRHGKVYAAIPYGYSRSGSGKTMSSLKSGSELVGDELAADPAEMAVLEQIQQWRTEGLTLRAIAGKLNAAEVPTKRGGKLWHASTVQSILSNDIHDKAA